MLIDDAIKWFNQKRNKYLVEPVIIRTATKKKAIAATVIEPETTVNAQGVKVQTNKYIFLFSRASVQNMDLKRGIHFTRRGQIYEAILDKRFVEEYNDPNNTTYAINAQLRP